MKRGLSEPDRNLHHTSGLTREEYYAFSSGFDEQMIYSQPRTAAEEKRRKTLIGFWFLGVLNNSSFVIMIAAATTISSGGIGLVYIASICPGVLMKTSAPYWYDIFPLLFKIISLLVYCTNAFLCVLFFQREFLSFLSFV
jgi:hypothetical protein